MIRKFFQFLFILIAAVSCSDETLSPDKSSFYYNYFPLDTTRSLVYRITEIIIDAPLDIRDTNIYFMKEKISDIISQNETDTTYLIHRYKRTPDDSLWIVSDVWSLRFDGTKIVKNEENQEFVRMIFPLTENSEWNGNAFNNLDEEMYSVISLHVSDTVNSMIFDSVATIEHINYKSIFEKKYAYEKYAFGTGLIEKYREDIESQGSGIDQSKPIETRITKGFIYKQELLQKP